jgi:predicted small lipoprotein YifL
MMKRMSHRLLVILSLVSCAAGCGEVGSGRLPDAPLPADAEVPPIDAPAVACTFVPAAATPASPLLAYTFTGGTFASFGCAPIDPTYWMSGSGMSVTIAFAVPQASPSIRVWGLNTDDTASVAVNGTAYSLDATSASLAPKVVCGLSPGNDGVAFVGGSLTGANTPAQGNFSYQDITLQTTGVTSLRLTGVTGAGWGFEGTCAR